MVGGREESRHEHIPAPAVVALAHISDADLDGLIEATQSVPPTALELPGVDRKRGRTASYERGIDRPELAGLRPMIDSPSNVRGTRK
jgi:hypothetical protein